MSNEPFFKSQADIQRWLLEEPGRKVVYAGYSYVVGYNDAGVLWNYADQCPSPERFESSRNWQPVPDPVPWYKHPEAVGALVWVWDNDCDIRLDTFIEHAERWSRLFKCDSSNWEEARPATSAEVREFLRKAEILEGLKDE